MDVFGGHKFSVNKKNTALSPIDDIVLPLKDLN
jgi:hypothetical protein